MRGDVAPKKPGSLRKTLATAMVIAGLVSFAAMFFPLQKAKPAGADDLAYFLPWCLVYGILGLAISGIGLSALLQGENKGIFFKAFPVFGIVAGGILIAESFPLVIVFSNWEFFISLGLIGGCVLGIGILTFKEAKAYSSGV